MKYFDFEQSYRIRASYRRFGLSHDGRTLIESLVVHWCSQSNMVGIAEEGKDSRVHIMASCTHALPRKIWQAPQRRGWTREVSVLDITQSTTIRRRMIMLHLKVM
jgi:hypothetical protein